MIIHFSLSLFFISSSNYSWNQRALDDCFSPLFFEEFFSNRIYSDTISSSNKGVEIRFIFLLLFYRFLFQSNPMKIDDDHHHHHQSIDKIPWKGIRSSDWMLAYLWPRSDIHVIRILDDAKVNEVFSFEWTIISIVIEQFPFLLFHFKRRISWHQTRVTSVPEIIDLFSRSFLFVFFIKPNEFDLIIFFFSLNESIESKFFTIWINNRSINESFLVVVFNWHYRKMNVDFQSLRAVSLTDD